MKKLIASLMSLMIMGAAAAALPADNSITQQMYASAQSGVEIDPAVVGEWEFKEDGYVFILVLKSNGVGYTFLGEESDYLIGNFGDENYDGGLFCTSNGMLYTYREGDSYRDVEGIEYIIKNDKLILDIWGTSIEFEKRVVPANFALGDVNGDGDVNAVDASFVLAIYASEAVGNTPNLSSAQRTAADVNGDDVINAIDASTILGYYSFIATGGSGSLSEFIKK